MPTTHESIVYSLRWQILVFHILNLEERVIDNSARTDSLWGFDCEALLQYFDQVDCGIFAVVHQFIFPYCAPNLFIDFEVVLFVFVEESWYTCDHVENDASQGPEINLLAIVASWVLKHIDWR